ncbi:DUF2147 domain-containing protein [Sphingosinithalassobacter sp. LHW66-3]|uniref:DUF2147 domain-containing protein n=1 Tax=Sphingosinithalassobacter sp. LHW66-3 TaxID=3424718 RepID=UPI003D6BB635
MKFPLIAAAALAALTTAPAQAQDGGIAGTWRTEDGSALVQIAPCGNQMCGRITRVLRSDRGPNPLDVNNPDESLRSRPIRGLTILSGFTRDGAVWRGRIYDPKSGKTYRSVLERTDPSRLSVKGCIAVFCREQNWSRAS